MHDRRVLATAATATTPDYDAIVRVVQLYIDGFDSGDGTKFREAFHQNAWIFFTDAEGVLHDHLISESFEAWAAGTAQVGRILSVTQAGDVASVLLGIGEGSDPAEWWVDVHALLRIDGVWKITNKTAMHSSRAAWAGASEDGA